MRKDLISGQRCHAALAPHAASYREIGNGIINLLGELQRTKGLLSFTKAACESSMQVISFFWVMKSTDTINSARSFGMMILRTSVILCAPCCRWAIWSNSAKGPAGGIMPIFNRLTGCQRLFNNCWRFVEDPLNGGTRQPPPSQPNSAPVGRGASSA